MEGKQGWDGTPGPGRGHKKLKDQWGDLLQDFEEALSTKEQKGERLGLKKARDLLHEDYVKFVTLYAKMGGGRKEKEVETVSTPVVGEKEVKVHELIRRLLDGFQAKAQADVGEGKGHHTGDCGGGEGSASHGGIAGGDSV